MANASPPATLADAFTATRPPTVTVSSAISALTRSRDNPLASASALSSRPGAASVPLMISPSPMLGRWGMDLELSSALIEQLLANARAAHPLEACGLLLGRAGLIEEVRACANVHPEPARHFEIDPQALVHAHRTARAGGPKVLGYYHSHPSGASVPSA